jgi:uncharacterized protein involved in outer membrane biogenesis
MKRIIIIIAAVVVVVVGGAVTLLAVYADTFIEKYRHDIAGLAIQVKEVEVAWLTYGITLKGVTIYPAGKERKRYRLGSAEEVRVSLVPYDLLRRMIHIRSLTLIKPKVTFIRTSMRHTNWEALNMSWLKEGDGKKEGEMGGWKLRVDNIEIEAGRFMFRDRVTGGRFDLREMKASVTNIVDEPNPKRLPSRVRVDGKLAKYDAPVTMQGRMNILAEGLNFNFTSHIRNAPITYFAPFYAGQVPFRIKSGRIAVVNGDLESGKLRVSSQVSKIIGNSILSDARKASPIRKVGEGIQRAGEKTGNAVRRLFRRRD